MSTVKEKCEEIKKFANESHCICFNLRKASRAITQKFDDLLRGVGLTATQSQILNSLLVLGSLTITEMAEAMATDRTTLSRNLKPLERDGFIKIQLGLDRRAREIVITDRGREISEKAFCLFKAFQEKLYEKVEPACLDRLCKDISLTLGKIQEI